MMRAFRFFLKRIVVLIAAEFAKTRKMGRKRQKEYILLHAPPQKPQIVEMRKLAQT